MFAVWGVLRRFNIRDNQYTIDQKTKERRPGTKIPDIEYANILLSARHSSISNAATYVKCGSTLYELVKEERNQSEQEVSPFRAIHLTVQGESSKDTAEAILLPSAPYRQATVALQADWFFKNDCVLPDGLAFDVYYQSSCDAKTKRTASESLDEWAEGNLVDGRKREELKALVAAITREAIRDAFAGSMFAGPKAPPPSQDDHQVKEAARASDGERTSEGPPKKKAKRGSEDLKALVDAARVLEKNKVKNDDLIKFYKEAEAQLSNSQTNLTDSARRWCRYRSKLLKGIQRCIQECHGGDKEAFYKQKGFFATTNYKCTCNK